MAAEIEIREADRRLYQAFIVLTGMEKKIQVLSDATKEVLGIVLEVAELIVPTGVLNKMEGKSGDSDA